jgi:hypothetical protein
MKRRRYQHSIIAKKHDYKTLVPGEIYSVKRINPRHEYIENRACVYESFEININCIKNDSRYSPNSKYYDIIKNGVIINPINVKVDDIITFRNRFVGHIIEDVTVNKIFYTYIFSRYSPKYGTIVNERNNEITSIRLYSMDIDVYDTMQTVMEKRTIKQLPLIDDVLSVINKFISKN